MHRIDHRCHFFVFRKKIKKKGWTKIFKILSSEFERSPQSKLDRGGCSEAKSVNFKSQAQTLLKEV